MVGSELGPAGHGGRRDGGPWPLGRGRALPGQPARAEFPRGRSEGRETSGAGGAGLQAVWCPLPPSALEGGQRGTPQVPSSWEENARSQEEEGEKCLRDSGNFSNQLLVRQRKCFLMFRLIIDQHSTCLIAASCRLTRGPRCGRWWSGGSPGVAATPHQSPSVRRCGRRARTHSEGTGVGVVSAQGMASPGGTEPTGSMPWPGDAGDSPAGAPESVAGQPTRPEVPRGARGWLQKYILLTFPFLFHHNTSRRAMRESHTRVLTQACGLASPTSRDTPALLPARGLPLLPLQTLMLSLWPPPALWALSSPRQAPWAVPGGRFYIRGVKLDHPFVSRFVSVSLCHGTQPVSMTLHEHLSFLAF